MSKRELAALGLKPSENSPKSTEEPTDPSLSGSGFFNRKFSPRRLPMMSGLAGRSRRGSPLIGRVVARPGCDSDDPATNSFSIPDSSGRLVGGSDDGHYCTAPQLADWGSTQPFRQRFCHNCRSA
jgi:hypothetical protein